MDILLGGTPWSGISLFGRAIGQHSDVFCWAGETALLHRIYQMVQYYPGNPESKLGIHHTIQKILHEVLIRREWQGSHETSGENSTLSKDDLISLAQSITDIIITQQSRSESMAACLRVLRAQLSQRNDRQFIAGQAPDNALLFSEHSDLPSHWAMIHRDPFAVVEASSGRADFGTNKGNIGFIERRIGLFNDHAEQIAKAAEEPERFFVTSYDRLLQDPVGVLANFCCNAGLDPTRRFLMDAASTIEMSPERDFWQHFSSVDRWKILNLCRDPMKILGYDEAYYEATFASMLRPLPHSIQPAILPLSGFAKEDQASEIFWSSPDAKIAVYAPSECRTLVINTYNRIDELSATLDRMGLSCPAYKIEAFAPRHAAIPAPAATLEIRPAVAQALTVDLTKLEPIASHGSFRLYRIELRANFGYTPVAMFPNNSDVRNLSYLVSGWSLG
jgi:hypothetical protein